MAFSLSYSFGSQAPYAGNAADMHKRVQAEAARVHGSLQSDAPDEMGE